MTTFLNGIINKNDEANRNLDNLNKSLDHMFLCSDWLKEGIAQGRDVSKQVEDLLNATHNVRCALNPYGYDAIQLARKTGE